ncbi:DUF192 domain-containing protein [Devosia sp.]|uniref:DUF192 domain-containing protein n=1 Tax=Devosia sp. TaxID=1871048 RepID=UPI00326488E9
MFSLAPRLSFSARPVRAAALTVAFLLSLTLAACSQEDRLTMHTAKGDFAFNLEIVDTPSGRAKGLMFRQELAPDAGMLFDFKEQRPVSFWMQNTLIPLDMVFIDAKGVVKSVHVNARPLDTTAIPSGAPVQFVLEIAGGRSVEIGLKAGDTMVHPRVSTLK